MRRGDWILFIATGIFFITGALFYPFLPASVASHWNAEGVINGYTNRFLGAFLVPVIFLIIAVILVLVPRIDPKRENIFAFRHYFDYFRITLAFVFYYIYLLTLLIGVGYQFSFTTALIPAIAVLYYSIGIMLPHTKPNWSIGIRTPWTISSDAVWRSTHRAGGILFKWLGVLGLLGMLFPSRTGFWFLTAPLIIAVIGLVIYSYILYERERD